MKKLLVIGVGVSMLLVIGFANAQLTQEGKTDNSIVEEPDNDQCGGLGNCERTCNSGSTGECEGSCNSIEHRNYNRGYGPRDGTGNKGCGPRDETGYGSKNCHK